MDFFCKVVDFFHEAADASRLLRDFVASPGRERQSIASTRGGSLAFFVALCFRWQNKLLTLWGNFVFFVFVVPAVMRRFGRKCSCDGEEAGEEHENLLNNRLLKNNVIWNMNIHLLF